MFFIHENLKTSPVCWGVRERERERESAPFSVQHHPYGDTFSLWDKTHIPKMLKMTCCLADPFKAYPCRSKSSEVCGLTLSRWYRMTDCSLWRFTHVTHTYLVPHQDKKLRRNGMYWIGGIHVCEKKMRKKKTLCLKKSQNFETGICPQCNYSIIQIWSIFHLNDLKTLFSLTKTLMKCHFKAMYNCIYTVYFPCGRG